MAIRTDFRSRTYRSLLEAKWASFFNLLDWEFEYEPYELEGWIPDFALIGQADGKRTSILVEVKPVVELPKTICEEMEMAAPSHIELLLLGTSPFKGQMNHAQLGWIGEATWADGPPDEETEVPDQFYTRKRWWQEAMFARFEGQPRIGICPAEGRFNDRISGQYDGGGWGSDEAPFFEIEQLWNKACNRVQWNPRRR